MAKDKNDLKKRPFLIMNSGYHANKPGLLIVDLFKTHTNEKYPLIVNIITHSGMYSGRDVRGYNYNGGTAGAVISTPTVTDLTGTDYYEAIYVGDSHGKVWKVDLQVIQQPAVANNKVTDNIACWGYNEDNNDDDDYGLIITNDDFYNSCSGYKTEDTKPRVIFEAKDADQKPQPITTKIAVGYHHEGVGIAFGTGSYDLTVDGSILSAKYNKSQSVYLIRDLSNLPDVDASKHTITRAELLKLSRASSSGEEYLYVPQQGISGDIKYGFYFDLHEGTGERVNVDPLFVNKYLFVATNTPVLSAECDGGGTSQIYKFGDWRDPTKDKVETTMNNWLVNKLDYVSINGKPFVIASGDGASGDEEGHMEEPIEIIIPLIINSSWLRLF
jgi:Tfp pilus tip-associated adhesin PilY1